MASFKFNKARQTQDAADEIHVYMYVVYIA